MQNRGTAVGANVAPTYVNIFVAELEESSIYVSPHFCFVQKWWRYIDDILIWTGSENQLHEFHGFLNSFDVHVKFMVVWSCESLQVFDTRVLLEGGQLRTDLFKKETNRNTVLRFDSCHPRKMIQALLFSQMLRARRIVSDEDKIHNTLEVMSSDFLQRGYPEHLVTTHRNGVSSMPRYFMLHNQSSKQLSKRIPIVSTYKILSPKVSNILNKYWPILGRSFKNIEEFQQPPLPYPPYPPTIDHLT